MPAAAVIPALRACSHIVAVKTPVVYIRPARDDCFRKKAFTANKSVRLEFHFKNDSAQYGAFLVLKLALNLLLEQKSNES